MTISYFAYGANMSRRVLARRGLSPLGSEPARLVGYRLRFSHRGLLPIEPAFANIEPCAGETVHGVLHRLSSDDLARLDRMEGAEYLREEVAVSGESSGAARAWTYRNPHPVPGLRPSRRYLASCCEGAREHGVPEAWVQELGLHPSLHVPIVSSVATGLVGIAERLRIAGLRPERVRMALRGREGRPTAPAGHDAAGSLLERLGPLPPAFPLRASALEVITGQGPEGFHRALRAMLRSATRRIVLASLYVGTGRLERELLDDIRFALSRSPDLRVQLVIDHSRGRRRTEAGTSESFVSALAREHPERVDVALHRMPQLEGKRGWLPSPLDECVAVFHLKVLVADDAAVLTGANLSDEYFRCRQARYVVVREPRLCDLLQSVVGEVARRSVRDGAAPLDASSAAAAVLARLATAGEGGPADADAWLVPVLQHPALGVHQERELLRRMLARREGDLAIATPYTNFPADYVDALAARIGVGHGGQSMAGGHARTRLLVPSGNSHSFTTGRGLKALVPGIYLQRERELARRLGPRAEVLHYDRPEWVFHAKGVWLEEAGETATVIGSSSFGGRSVARDFDLSYLLVTRDPALRRALAAELDTMLEHARAPVPVQRPGTLASQLVAPLVRSYL